MKREYLFHYYFDILTVIKSRFKAATSLYTVVLKHILQIKKTFGLIKVSTLYMFMTPTKFVKPIL